MITYIKKNVKGYYVTFPKPLNNVDLGKNYSDFIFDKWVPLTEEQVLFHQENPKASVSEVFHMKLNEPFKPQEPERTLEMAKDQAIQKLNTYDNSNAVNEFTINNSIKAWFTVQERTNYKNSLDSAKLLGVDTLQFFVGDQAFSISVDIADGLLATIQMYADACFIQTKNHENAIKALETIEEVDNYDFTIGYPNKLNFEL